MSINININSQQLLLNSFGMSLLKSQIYKPGIDFVVNTANIKRDISTLKNSQGQSIKSSLGTSIFSWLHFDKVSIGEIVYEHDSPVDTCLFNVHQIKKIIETNVQGKDESIKEYIGKSSYEINIKGIICGANGAYPQMQVDNLIGFLDLPYSLPINSPYLNDRFNIYEIVIFDYELGQEPGSQSYQTFNIQAKSDKPVILQLKQSS